MALAVHFAMTMLTGHARAILVIENEAPIRRAVRKALHETTSRIIEATTGSGGVESAATEHPDLIVLDLGLPDMAGIDVCREIRRWGTMPIVVLSVHDTAREKVLLLNAGADDYITKPFSTVEFVARVHAQLRRTRTPGAPLGPILTTGDGLLVDFARRIVTRDGIGVELTDREWSILLALAREPDRALTLQQIVEAVWGPTEGSFQQSLRVHITNLRRKIELNSANPRLIITVPGVGYRLESPPI
jgi:two-component system KDP operon response regulator KdpE